MSLDDVHPIYPFTAEDVKEIRKELGLKESTIEEDVDAIIEWFQKQPHLVDAGIERAFVERMLIVAKGSMEKTKRRIDNYYKYRLFAPEIFQGREKVLNDSADLWDFYLQVTMPKLYKGHRVTVIKITDTNPSSFSDEVFMRNTFMLGDIRMKHDYFLGDIWVLDLKNATFGHVLRLSPTIMQKSAHVFHEGLGLRINTIHVLNATNLLNHTITFMKQFFSPKIMERIQVHDTLEDLHKHLPTRYLPKDFGGEERSMVEFKDMYEKEMRSTHTKQFLLNAMKMVSNENKRPNASINEEYLAGSFRKLDFD